MAEATVPEEEKDMTLQRSDRLKETPVVGKWYLVPAILWANGVWTHDVSEARALQLIQSDERAARPAIIHAALPSAERNADEKAGERQS